MRAYPVHTQESHCIFLKQRNCLIVSIQQPLDDQELAKLGDQVMEVLKQYHSSSAILDLSGLDVMDSFSTQSLQRLCETLSMYSIATVIAGIQPGVAISMALRGLSLKGVRMAIDLSDALALLDPSTGYAFHTSGNYPSVH